MSLTNYIGAKIQGPHNAYYDIECYDCHAAILKDGLFFFCEEEQICLNCAMEMIKQHLPE